MNDVVPKIPILIGAPFKHTLCARELPDFLQPRVNPIFVSLIEVSVLPNKHFLELWISLLVFRFLHIEWEVCNKFLSGRTLQHFSISPPTTTQPFKRLESRRRVLKLIISTEFHCEDTVRRHITIPTGHIIDKLLPGIKYRMQSLTDRLNPIMVCHINNGTHIAHNIFLRTDKMELVHAADTLFIAQYAHDIETGTVLRNAKVMGRIDVRTDVITQRIQLLLNHLPSASPIMSRQSRHVLQKNVSGMMITENTTNFIKQVATP